MLTTAFLYITVYLVEALGCLFLFLCGYGLLWGKKIRSLVDLQSALAPENMDTFHAGLAACPILLAVIASSVYDSWAITLWTLMALIIPALFLHFFRINLFIPIFSVSILFFSLLIGAAWRISYILMAFLLYLLIVCAGPLFLAFFLSAV